MHDAFGTQEVSTCVRVRVRLQSPRVSPEECQCLHKEVQLLMLSELQRGEQQRREEQRMEALLAHTHTQLELLRGLNYTLPLFFFPFVLSSFFKQKLSTWLESQTVSRHFGRFQADCFYCVLSCRSTFFPILWVLYINIMTINSVFYEVYIITFTGCKCKATQCKCFLLNSWRLERAAIDWWREHIYLNLPNLPTDAPPLPLVTATCAESFLSPSGPIAARARDAHNAMLQAGRLPWWRTLGETVDAVTPDPLLELEAELGGLYVGGTAGVSNHTEVDGINL